MKICTKCSLSLPLSKFHRRSPPRDKTLYAWCKSCMSKVTIDKHRLFKQKALKYKGGKCTICGYYRCARALVFHHINPLKKDFTISHDTSRNWEKVRSELDKCVLLCHNCHAEVHDGLLSV